MNKEQIIEAIKAMTVLELNELVKACEEEFGVSAAAPVAVVGAAGGAAAAEEQTEFTVVLESAGAEKIKVIKAVREIDKTYETEIEYELGQNKEKKYIGRFFKVNGTDCAIWAGYDPDYDFNVSFSFTKDNEQILKNILQMYNPQKIIDGKGDSWFVINLNVIINNTGNIQVGGENNTQKNMNKSSTDSKPKSFFSGSTTETSSKAS